jgi:hypothetical protein
MQKVSKYPLLHRSNVYARFDAALCALSLVLLSLVSQPAANVYAEDAATAIERRLGDAVRYLASDELEGRGIGTKGLDAAAQYIANEFAELGLKTDLFDGTAFQNFTASADAEMGPAEKNRLALIGPSPQDQNTPQRIDLKLAADFNTMAIGGSGSFDLPLVFAGYGITANEYEYDDYRGLDVQDKAVLILRKEPQQANPHSVFSGQQTSQHALFNRKVANAFEHGAAAVILVNARFDIQQKSTSADSAWDQAVDKLVEIRRTFQKIAHPTDEQFNEHRAEINRLAEQVQTLGARLTSNFDQVLDFTGAGQDSSHPKTPVFFASREVFDRVVQQSLGKDLATIEREIDVDLKPRSGELHGWRIAGEASVNHRQTETRNVIGVLEGSGPHANETVIVGAHYDHLGYGGAGSLAPWTKEIHNGADDNASGTAALIEIARTLTMRDKRPARRVVFIAFSGEERGLLGSARYVKTPLFPLEQTVAMVNMDMVGRLNENKLVVHGTGTADELDALVDQLNPKHGFEISKSESGFGPSDHASFYAKQIPVLHIFTGSHQDYHRPSDDADKINLAGMRRVSGFVADIVESLADSDSRPTYKATRRPKLASGGDRPYFGSIPDFSQPSGGYALQGVASDSPAERAGIKAEDVIVKFGESKIGSLEDFDSALRKYKAGNQVPVTLLRAGKTLTLDVTLDPPR